eukprot:gene14432-biopygen5115
MSWNGVEINCPPAQGVQGAHRRAPPRTDPCAQCGGRRGTHARSRGPHARHQPGALEPGPPPPDLLGFPGSPGARFSRGTGQLVFVERRAWSITSLEGSASDLSKAVQ